MSDSRFTLFGRPVFISNRMTLADQAYDTLVEEIQSGHWQEGDRLPSIADLAEQSGLSKMPISQAFTRLKEEGYTRQNGRKGTFLRAILPHGRLALGAIGVALVVQNAEMLPYPHAQWMVHRIIEAAGKRNYTVSVQYLMKGDPFWQEIDSPAGPFGGQVKGVISFATGKSPQSYELPADRLPMVCLHSGREGYPRVELDTRGGAYQLTRKLIELGHRQILWLPASIAHEEAIYRLEGHTRAMKEAGLEVRHDVIEGFNSVDRANFLFLRELLADRAGATAIICNTRGQATSLIGVADLSGIRIPEDVSVAVVENKPLNPGNLDRQCAGIEFEFDRAVEMCLDLLIEQIQTRRIAIDHVTFRAHFVGGDTLAPHADSRDASRSAAAALSL